MFPKDFKDVVELAERASYFEDDWDSNEIPLVEESCPICGSEMTIKSSSYGQFLSCVYYPACKGKRSL